MLEQAIVDATALREAALKNAEQAIIEKYAPQIKEAVESLLENDNSGLSIGSTVRETNTGATGTIREIDEDGVQVVGEDGGVFLSEAENLEETQIIQEEEMNMAQPTSMGPTPPLASSPESIVNPNQQVSMNMEFEFDPSDFSLNLSDIQGQVDADPMSDGESLESTEDLLGDLGTDTEQEIEAEEDPLSLEEMINDLAAILEEDLVVDMKAEKHGWVTTDEGTLNYDQEMQLASMESTKYKEENEAMMKRVAELQESLSQRTKDATNLLRVVEQLKNKLDEVLVSNARLVYSNKTLSDASLNERQKSKIVETIATAQSTEEAKTLHETLTATVGSTPRSNPKSLSESVNRKSNLSSMMPRRKENVVTESMSFAERMRKLAGIN
jgi:hypothetical protein